MEKHVHTGNNFSCSLKTLSIKTASLHYLANKEYCISTLVDSFNWTHNRHSIGKSKMFILLKQKFIFIYTLSINLPVYLWLENNPFILHFSTVWPFKTFFSFTRYNMLFFFFSTLCTYKKKRTHHSFAFCPRTLQCTERMPASNCHSLILPELHKLK